MSGPSKEELQNYWKSNRQYFELLAKHYYASDRKYYDEFIAPFYSSAIGINVVTNRNRSASVFVIAFLVALMTIAGILAFFLIQKTDKRDEIKLDTKDTLSNKYDKNNKVYDSDYMKGLMYISEKDYDNAEYYLKKVSKDEPDYKSAQQVLESIRYLKKYDK